MMKVLNICIGKAEKTSAKSGLTGHFKQPTAESVAIHAVGLEGDTICDLNHHGGPDQAVYLFGDPDRAWFASQMGRDIGPGYFGENLLISDLHSAEIAIGDRLQIGTVTLEITSPRVPCATYHAHVGSPTAIRDFLMAGRPGAYARVLKPGEICGGDTVEFTRYIGDRVTMEQDLAHYATGGTDFTHWQRILTVPAHHKAVAKAREWLAQ